VRAIIVLTAFQSNLVPPFWVGSSPMTAVRAALSASGPLCIYIYRSSQLQRSQLQFEALVCVRRQQKSMSMTLATKLRNSETPTLTMAIGRRTQNHQHKFTFSAFDRRTCTVGLWQGKAEEKEAGFPSVPINMSPSNLLVRCLRCRDFLAFH